MGKLQDNIRALIDSEYGRGIDGAKISTRLIEAGLKMMDDEGDLDESSRLAPHFDKRGAFDSFSISTFTERGVAKPDSVSIERDNVLRAAAGQFDTYARNHLEKGPGHEEKAQRNIDMAAQCYSALGEPYDEPFRTAEEMPKPIPALFPGSEINIKGADDWKASLQAPEPAQESDSAIGAAGSALELLKRLYAAEIGGDPTMGVQVPLDDADFLKALVELGYSLRNELTDFVTITTKGKEALGIRPEGVPDLPVTVADVTGNIAEAELAARYIDGKIKGVEAWIAKNGGNENVGDFDIMARVLTEIAREFRIGQHLPDRVIEGRIIPYNEDRDTGVRHATALQAFFDDVYARNVKAGWWSDITTGQPKKRNVGELFILFVTEIAEAYESYVLNTPDDKLPDYPGLGVELGDLAIRLADFCGALAAGNVVGYSPGSVNPGAAMFMEIVDIAGRYEAIRKTPEAIGDTECGEFIPAMLVGPMIDAKLDFNAKREDHKIENRLKDDGKRT